MPPVINSLGADTHTQTHTHTHIHTYGTNHPQLKRHTRVTRVCVTCAKAKNTRGIKLLVYTRVHTSTRV